MKVSLLKELKGHKDAVYALSSSTKHELLSVGGDGLLVNWNVAEASGTALVSMPFAIYDIAINKKAVFFSTIKGIVGNYQLGDSPQLLQWQVNEKPLYKLLQWGKNALAVISGSGELFIMNALTGQLETTLQLSTKNLRSIAVNTSGTLVAIGDSDSKIHILSTDTCKVIATLEGHSNSIFSLLFKGDTTLISGSRDAHIKVWNVIEGEQNHSIPAHLFTVNQLVFSPDRKMFASASRDKTIRIWDSNSFELLKVIDREKHPKAHTHSVNTLLWTNNYLASAGDDRRILLWCVEP